MPRDDPSGILIRREVYRELLNRATVRTECLHPERLLPVPAPLLAIRAAILRRCCLPCLTVMELFARDVVAGAVAQAIKLGAFGFDAVKQLTLARVERRAPRLDMAAYPYLGPSAGGLLERRPV